MAGLVKTEIDLAAWDFFSASTLSIEILKDDVLQKIHFQVKDKVRQWFLKSCSCLGSLTKS